VAKISLRLYIAGETVVSQKARENLQRLCERCSFPIEATITDVLREPQLADDARILATPTLIYERPAARSKRIIGDLSDIDKIVDFLGLQQGNHAHEHC
jgi:circadian clock protein KaiB